MKIFVKAKPNSKKEKVEEITTLFDNPNEKNFIIFVKEQPVKGIANKAIIKVLANHLNIPSSKLKIVKGEKSRNKVLIIL